MPPGPAPGAPGAPGSEQRINHMKAEKAALKQHQRQLGKAIKAEQKTKKKLKKAARNLTADELRLLTAEKDAAAAAL